MEVSDIIPSDSPSIGAFPVWEDTITRNLEHNHQLLNHSDSYSETSESASSLGATSQAPANNHPDLWMDEPGIYLPENIFEPLGQPPLDSDSENAGDRILSTAGHHELTQARNQAYLRLLTLHQDLLHSNVVLSRRCHHLAQMNMQLRGGYNTILDGLNELYTATAPILDANSHLVTNLNTPGGPYTPPPNSSSTRDSELGSGNEARFDRASPNPEIKSPGENNNNILILYWESSNRAIPWNPGSTVSAYINSAINFHIDIQDVTPVQKSSVSDSGSDQSFSAQPEGLGDVFFEEFDEIFHMLHTASHEMLLQAQNGAHERLRTLFQAACRQSQQLAQENVSLRAFQADLLTVHVTLQERVRELYVAYLLLRRDTAAAWRAADQIFEGVEAPQGIVPVIQRLPADTPQSQYLQQSGQPRRP
ncbi:hypothetical protein FB451DRAFT_1177634 [Mycena latifolia]|nr:hypothetical protein FB451DRAFT_1177634 [Mycena latifolia]